jgi:hypothetical protein
MKENFVRKERRETGSSLALTQDRAKDIHEFASFGGKAIALLFQRRVSSTIEQTKPVNRFLVFLTAGLDSQEKVLFAHRLVRLDVIGTHRARGSDKLFTILKIPDCARKLLHETANFLREQKGTFVQVIRPTIRPFRIFAHFLDSNSGCFGFRY